MRILNDQEQIGLSPPSWLANSDGPFGRDRTKGMSPRQIALSALHDAAVHIALARCRIQRQIPEEEDWSVDLQCWQEELFQAVIDLAETK
jgi:hypothetical protein